MPVKYYARTYKESDDPLSSWGTLRRDISGLTLARLNALLRRELKGKRRAVVLRALTGRINAIEAQRRGLDRLPREEHAAMRARLGLPSRSRRKDE